MGVAVRWLALAAVALLVSPQDGGARAAALDLSATGTPEEMIGRLLEAERLRGNARSAMAFDQEEIDRILARQAAMKAEGDDLAEQWRQAAADLEDSAGRSKAACTHFDVMRKWTQDNLTCLQWRRDLTARQNALEQQKEQVRAQQDEQRKSAAAAAPDHERLRAELRRLADWQAAVEPGIASLRAALEAACQPPTLCPAF